MRVCTRTFITAIAGSFLLLFADTAQAQQYKIRQGTTMMGIKSESTVYVRGPRKRTEAAIMPGQAILPVIEQCDLKRTITLNDKRKLYFIEPFAKDDGNEEEKEEKPNEKVNPTTNLDLKDGRGVINSYYNIRDTGERKKMNGFTARHVWTTQRMIPSGNTCSMKDSFIIKTDGWYIDLPQFTCPVQSTTRPASTAADKPECKDKYVSHKSGSGKLGFPLTEKRTIIMGNGKEKMTEMETNLETVEFKPGKVDSMLFEIPEGYNLASTKEELQEKFDINAMIKEKIPTQEPDIALDVMGTAGDKTDHKSKYEILIGVFEPTGEDQVKSMSADLQAYIVETLHTDKIGSVAVKSEEDAKEKGCYYLLNTDFQKIKQGSKLGGLVKAVKNSDPNAATTYSVEGVMLLRVLGETAAKLSEKISGKFDGKVEDAARKSLEGGCKEIIRDLK